MASCNSFFFKITFLFMLVATTFFINPLLAQQHSQGRNFISLSPNITESDLIKAAANVTPSAKQLAWQRLETTAFVHFGTNTFYNQEWGQGTENPERFNPTLLNTDQWAKVIKEAGFNMLIFTCKHHDGLCMWPSKFTNHTIAASPWLNGNGDLVKQVAESCQKYKLKFGIYLSPWDRHESSYGNTDEYNKFFLNQLTELLTNYGTVDEVWFDGACGEGANGKKQVYDWDAYYALIHKLQPNAVIAVMGPDVRWVGTESGYGRETEWSVVPYAMADQEKIAENSQQAVSKDGFVPTGDMVNMDLGSREAIKNAQSLIWYPSEVDVSIRPGWFWHASENTSVKSPEKLLDIYFSSVGRNSVLLLNIPPDTNGLIHEADIKSLTAWKGALNTIFKQNLAKASTPKSVINKSEVIALTDNNDTTYWDTGNDTTYSFELELEKTTEFDILLLQENICIGQRIEQFNLQANVDGGWKTIIRGTTVGYKRLLRFPAVKTNRIRFTIEHSRLAPALSEFGLYKQLPVVEANPSSASFREKVSVTLSCSEAKADIFYTTDGSAPNQKSRKYKKPFNLQETTKLNCIAIRKDGTSGFLTNFSFQKADYDLQLLNAPDGKYSGGGPFGLVDKAKGSADFADGRWSGFNGTDLECIIDLGKEKELNHFGINFNENTKSWIFRPQSVEFSVSTNGKDFETIHFENFENPEKDSEQIIPINFEHLCKARYIKVKAINFGLLPAWHPGKGEPAWLFVDEITVE
jgi:alpha-L-fucosidase